MNPLPLAAPALERAGAQVAQSKSGFTIVLRDGTQLGEFRSPPDPMILAETDREKASTASWATQDAIGALVGLRATIDTVGTDQRLSSYGRTEALAPHRERALRSLLGSLGAVDAYADNIAQLEDKRYAVPASDRNDLYGEMQAREIRDYVRSVNGDERKALFAELGTGEDSALLRAVLRSPLRLGNMETVARAGWRTRIDRDDPDGRAFLDLGQRSLDWTRGNLGMIRSMMKPLLDYQPENLFEIAGKRGLKQLGYSDADALNLERMVLARRRSA